MSTSNTKFDLNIRSEICYLGTVEYQNVVRPFGILRDDRRRHTYILGKTGMGKSTLLQNMVLQDIYNGEGICFIDPHGESAAYIMDRIPSYRQNDVIYFDPADTSYPIAFNILEQSEQEKYLIASSMMAVFTKIWSGMWSTRMEYILNNCILALLDSPGNTMLGISRMLSDKNFRKKIVDNVTDPIVKSFWEKEFPSFGDKYKQEAIAPIQNKIGQFLSSSLMRNIVGQAKSSLDLRGVMDQRKILIINLSKGKVGEDASNLLGALLISKLQLAAMSRTQPEEERHDFYMYVDEFQNFTTDSFATILSEARKYRLNLILAHQYIAQLTEDNNNFKIRNAVFGNVGTILCFRVGSDDGESLEKEFTPVFTSQHLQNLNARQLIVKMSIDNSSASPFLANTLPPLFTDKGGRFDLGLRVSRERYTTPVEKVTESIDRWLKNNIAPSNPNQNKAKKINNNNKETQSTPATAVTGGKTNKLDMLESMLNKIRNNLD